MTCIIHAGYKQPDGYGQKKYKGKVVLAHRLAYALANGLDVFSMGGTVMHACDNPSCINPEHLSLGTMQLNSDDCRRKGRQASKLTQEQADEIRRRFIPGKAGRGGYPGNYKILSLEYGVDRAVIHGIVRGSMWLPVSTTRTQI